jgi:histidinol-phosphate aminotransferase
MSWRDLVRAPLRPAAAYHVPVASEAVKLDANESPFSLSPAAQAEVDAALRDPALHRYPDARARELRGVMGEWLDDDGDQLSLGNGSDELIGLLCAAFGEPRPGSTRAAILYPAPGFVVFKTAAHAHGLEVIEVPFGPRFAPDQEALLAAVERERPNLIFLATPNNPTGTVWPRFTIETLLQRFPDVITVVDEAYLAYGSAPSARDLALLHPHCLCLGTLSKIGMAGLRIGFLVGRKEVIAEVEKVRPPYNLGTLAQRAATLILSRHRDQLAAHFSTVKGERERLRAALEKHAEVFPSEANFLLIRVADARACFQRLLERGVLVRLFDTGLLHGCLRVTVGTPDENDRLIAAMG